MSNSVVTYRVWKSDTLVEEHQVSANPQQLYQAPNVPSTDQQRSILGIQPDSELLEQRQQIMLLLDTLQDTGARANASLTDLMAQHASTTSKSEAAEDYSSGEDAGDPNESTFSHITNSLVPTLRSRINHILPSHDLSIPYSNSTLLVSILLCYLFMFHPDTDLSVIKPPKAKRRKL